MLDFIIHIAAKLLNAQYLRYYVSLTVYLQVLPDTLRAKKLYTLQAHVPHYFAGMHFAVVRGEGSGLFDGGGGRQKRAGAGILIGGGSMETCVFFVQKVHRFIIIDYYTSMGSESSNSHQRFYQRYNFVQALNDRNFGLVKVYRKKQLNFDYVMVFERVYSPSQLSTVRQQLQRIKSRYSLQQQPLFLKILSVEQLQENGCGGNVLRIYLEYLNYTLKDAINTRKQAMQPFTSDQIMYVMQNAIAAFNFLKILNANYLTVRPDSIYINPDGMLRFNPTRIQKVQTQNQNCNCISVPNEVHFEKSQRQFLIQLKSTLLDLVEICPQNDQNFKRNYQILAKINHSRTLQQVISNLWHPQVDSLLSGKKLETTELSSGGGRQGIFGQSLAKSKISLRDSGYKFK